MIYEEWLDYTKGFGFQLDLKCAADMLAESPVTPENVRVAAWHIDAVRIRPANGS